jgi:hypothetical protein
VWLTGLTTATSTSPPCIEVSVTAVNNERFTINFRSWKKAQLKEAICNWIAYPKDHDGIDSGTFATTEVHDATRPTSDTSHLVRMKGGSLAGRMPPRVVVGLNKIDCAAGRNLRVAVSVENVSTSSFRWHISTWGYSVLYSAGASWIALDQ